MNEGAKEGAGRPIRGTKVTKEGGNPDEGEDPGEGGGPAEDECGDPAKEDGAIRLIKAKYYRLN